VSAGSLDELALAAEIPVAALVETVERFNRFAETGVDEEFHRGEDEYDTFFATGAGPNKALLPLDSPPYFAARFVLSDLGTKGGLVTDAAGRVLQENGAPLPGLYAAGNTASSVFGSVYPGPGAPLGSAMVFAALAVEDMAR
ncbi:MAG TPA: FAD-binding protein, partial [Nocardioides sp.]|nr:FAD-binding protein [Nocardioides sp.]